MSQHNEVRQTQPGRRSAAGTAIDDAARCPYAAQRLHESRNEFHPPTTFAAGRSAAGGFAGPNRFADPQYGEAPYASHQGAKPSLQPAYQNTSGRQPDETSGPPAPATTIPQPHDAIWQEVSNDPVVDGEVEGDGEAADDVDNDVDGRVDDSVDGTADAPRTEHRDPYHP